MPGIHQQKAQAQNTNKHFHQSEAGGKTALTQAKWMLMSSPRCIPSTREERWHWASKGQEHCTGGDWTRLVPCITHGSRWRRVLRRSRGRDNAHNDVKHEPGGDCRSTRQPSDWSRRRPCNHLTCLWERGPRATFFTLHLPNSKYYIRPPCLRSRLRASIMDLIKLTHTILCLQVHIS